jgi:HEPN domain-containing protein
MLDHELRDPHLNNFALCCFRDTADGDYIAARMAFRAKLIRQALWASEQAIEKYLKCILLLRRIEANKPSHSPVKLLKRLETQFPLALSDEVREFIGYIEIFGPDRYFTYPYVTDGLEIIKLDWTVWQLRRYCINYHRGSTPNSARFSQMDTKHIEDSVNRPPRRYQSLAPGELDEILAKRTHPARAALIWNNPCFGAGTRRTIRIHQNSMSANSPLALYPEIIDEVRKYVFLPKDVMQQLDTPS